MPPTYTLPTRKKDNLQITYTQWEREENALFFGYEYSDIEESFNDDCCLIDLNDILFE